MFPQSLANANDIQKWADQIESRSNLPDLIRRLILATSQPRNISFRANEGVDIGGWDGILNLTKSTTFLPKATSGWEMGVNKSPRTKANKDYKNRTEFPDPIEAKKSTFIFCTPRRWAQKTAWAHEKKQEKKWKDIRVFDVDDITTWFIEAHGVHVWFSLLIGKPIESVEDIYTWWESWSKITSPPLSSDILLCGRNEACSNLISMLSREPDQITVKAESVEGALAFVASSFEAQASPLRGQLFNRTLIVESRDAWRYFSSSSVPLILIPKFEDVVLINQAYQNGHTVIIPLGLSHPFTATISIPRISALDASQVMEKEGISPTVARHSAGILRRNLNAFRRTHANIQLNIPKWAQAQYGQSLLPLILAGEWDESVKADRVILESLTGISYQEIGTSLIQWRDTQDPLFRQIGTKWCVNSKEDAWRLLAKYTSPEILSTFDGILFEVLLEPDPNRGLSQSERIRSEIEGTKKKYSSTIKTGLSDSLAMLGAIGSQDNLVNTPGNINTGDFARRVVNKLMDQIINSPELWLDMAPHLSSLAEAAPEAFINSIEKDLRSTNPTITTLYKPQPGLLSPNYEFPDLLWALENLSWSDKYFPRVSYILAKISIIECQTNLINSASNSLLSFFRLWLPQCGANLDLRIQSLDKIRHEMPDVAWKLMINLLPTGHDFATLHSGPGARAVLWREWPSEAKKPSREEYWRSLELISSRILDDVNKDIIRWNDLIEHLSHLHPSIYKKAIGMLDSLSQTIVDGEIKNGIWSRLRKLISKHRAFKSAKWAIPSDQLDILAELRDKFIPTEPSDKHRWLFQHHPQMSKKYEHYEDYYQVLEKFRVEALEDIIEFGGIELVKIFSESVEVPSAVGSALYSTNPDSHSAKKIIDVLAKGNSLKQVAQSYIRRAIDKEGTKWFDSNINSKTLNRWSPEIRASALLCLPFDPNTIDIVESYDEETQKHYWIGIHITPSEDSIFFHRAISCLIKYDFPRKAVSILAMYSYDGMMPLELSIVHQSLYLSAQVPLEKDPTQLREYDIRQLLNYFRCHPDSDKEAVEQIEWIYLPMLYFEPEHLHLHTRLNNDPDFFVEVVGLCFKKDEPNVSTSMSSEDSDRARYLLDSWHQLPGKLPNGEINAEYLNNWLDRALIKLNNEDLKTGGFVTIGQLLYWGPVERDGVWPDPVICDILQDLSNDIVDRHFQIAVYNNRGITSRSPFAGGAQEYELSKKYHEYAKKTAVNWPRVSDILTRIAFEYQSEGKYHDHEAERDEDNIG